MKHAARLAALMVLGLSLTACGRPAPIAASALASRPVQAKSLAGVQAALKATLAAEFRDQDRDQNGLLSPLEFKGSALHAALFEASVQKAGGALPSQAEAFKALDGDANGGVGLAEYVAPLLTEKAIAKLRNDLATAFKGMDRNHDAFVTQGELAADAQGILAMADRDGDHKVDLSEFEDAVVAGVLPVTPSATRNPEPAAQK